MVSERNHVSRIIGKGSHAVQDARGPVTFRAADATPDVEQRRHVPTGAGAVHHRLGADVVVSLRRQQELRSGDAQGEDAQQKKTTGFARRERELSAPGGAGGISGCPRILKSADIIGSPPLGRWRRFPDRPSSRGMPATFRATIPASLMTPVILGSTQCGASQYRAGVCGVPRRHLVPARGHHQ